VNGVNGEAFLRLFAIRNDLGAGSFKSRNGILNGEIVMRSACEMRPDRNPCPASISDGGLGIHPMGSIRIAAIEALPESMRRSRGNRSAATTESDSLYRGPRLE
jgi:hypothetical protein